MTTKPTTHLINRLTEPSQTQQLELPVDGEVSPATTKTAVTTGSPDSDSNVTAYQTLSNRLIERIRELYYDNDLQSMYAFLGELETCDEDEYPDAVTGPAKVKLRDGIARLKKAKQSQS